MYKRHSLFPTESGNFAAKVFDSNCSSFSLLHSTAVDETMLLENEKFVIVVTIFLKFLIQTLNVLNSF